VVAWGGVAVAGGQGVRECHGAVPLGRYELNRYVGIAWHRGALVRKNHVTKRTVRH